MEGKKESALRFFQQSAWITIATTVGTIFMGGVHFLARRMPTEVYGDYTAQLQIWQLMTIPSLGLQAVFMQYAVSGQVLGRRAVLAGAVRGVFRLNAFLWAVLAMVFVVWHEEVKRWLNIPGSGALVIVLLVPLVSAPLSILNGVLQGEQDFLWFGGVAIAGGLSRFLFVLLLIICLGPTPTHAAAGVLLGFCATLLVAAWRKRQLILWEESVPFHWRPFFWKAVLVTLGLGSGVYLMSLDTVMVNYFAHERMGIYGTAGMVGKVLLPLSCSLLAVMFPKIARGKALAEKTDALLLTLVLTAVAAIAASIVLTLIPEFLVRNFQGEKYLGAAPLVPLYCWAQIPLVLGTILLYNLVARERYAVVPFLVLIACGYYWALRQTLTAPEATLKQVIQIMGLAGLVFLAVTVFFTWVWKEKTAAGLTPSRDPAP